MKNTGVTKFITVRYVVNDHGECVMFDQFFLVKGDAGLGKTTLLLFFFPRGEAQVSGACFLGSLACF